MKQIPLPHSLFAFVDDDLFDFFSTLDWDVVRCRSSWYARTHFKTKLLPRQIYMHRLVAKTPSDQVTHHKNRNSLDNRRCNLVNMSRQAHHRLHENDTLTVKYANTAPDLPFDGPP